MIPLPGARYRVKQTKKGPIRLAFKDGQVEEAKNLKTGAVHTPEEFAADRAHTNGGSSAMAKPKMRKPMMDQEGTAEDKMAVDTMEDTMPSTLPMKPMMAKVPKARQPQGRFRKKFKSPEEVDAYAAKPRHRVIV